MTELSLNAAIHNEGWLFCAQRRNSPHKDSRPLVSDSDGSGAITLIVIHNISLPAGVFGTDDIDALFMGTLDTRKHPDYVDLKDLKVSSHFVITRCGEIRQYVNIYDRAWHAGLSNFRGRNRCNDFSVGIELEGTDDIPYTDAQYQALALVIRALKECLPISWVTAHSTIAPGRKTDPGQSFDWERLARVLPAGVESAYAPENCDREALARYSLERK